MLRSKMWSRYLLWFAHEHLDFRHAEIQSILTMFNIPMNFIERPSSQNPYWIVELPNEECAKKIASRSVSIKNCIELWSTAQTYEQLHKNLRGALQNREDHWVVPEEQNLDTSEDHICPSSLIQRCCDVEKSFKIEVETFCKHFSLKEKVQKIENFSYLPLVGPVKLCGPDVTLMCIEFYGTDPNRIPDEPYNVFFGRWVVDGQRDLIHYHSLKKRRFIGNTSMDAQLSLLMVNQAQVEAGDMVLDPFVGSGSILVAAAHFGGFVWGTDIDYMMLHARTRPSRVGHRVRSQEESVLANMLQYNIASKYMDVVVSDFSMQTWREGCRFDGIITDPPYGIREPTERIGIDKEHYILSEKHLENHIPAKVDYGLPHLYCDLLNFAAKYLTLGRRLVCWYPLVREEYKKEDLPSHPCMRLVANSEQVLTKLTSRRLLTYEKIHELGTKSSVHTKVGEYNFREKYFASVESTRRERRERKAEEIATNKKAIESRINNT